MHISVGRWGIWEAGFRALLAASLAFSAVAGLAQSDLIGDVRERTSQNGFAATEEELRAYKAQHGATPEYVEALSWMARGASAVKQWDRAAGYANETLKLCEKQLATHKLDADPHTPIALGAAYEVLAQAMAQQGRRPQAIELLRHALARYGNTSVAPRLRKNLNLLSLVGAIAPALEVADYLGPKPKALTSLKGSPVLLFFWAHWCSDCKAEVPVIARLRQEFALQGLIVMGPTQLYGYAAQGNDASPSQERAYIEAVRQRYYVSLLDVPVPLSKRNFSVYGASTTPTLVVLDRAGKVAMYHPGAMPYDELRAALEKAVK